jgi:hypothetical protein
LLTRHSEKNLRVFVVWEPILPTDWRPPSGSTLARISDRRARQFWDPKHVVARALNEIVKQKPPQPEPTCCTQNGFYWDEAIFYASNTRWEAVPTSAFWNGPVLKVIPSLEKAFNDVH